MADALLTAFRFEVQLLRSPDIVAGQQNLPGAGDGYNPPQGAATLGTGGFQECAGLEIEMDVQEYLEGGRNNATVRRIGRAKFQPILLKRGMFFGTDGDGQVNTD